MKKILFTFLFITTIFAQDLVSIVTSGDGPTKDQATTAALRNAIEQAYGAFISSNTKFLNDELIQDEIVSLSQGTITEYSIISSIETKNGYNVTTKSTVSLGKLTSFVQSKGGKTELAGALFARNIKIFNFNEENEQKALEHMYEAVLQMAKSGFYDFSIAAKQPVETDSGNYSVKLTAEVIPNQNYYSAMDYIRKTLESVSLSESEARNYDKINRTYQWFEMFYLVEGIYKKKSNKKLRSLMQNKEAKSQWGYKTYDDEVDETGKQEKTKTIILRGKDSISIGWLLDTIEIFHNEALKFTIKNGITTPYNNYIPGNIVWNNVNKQQNGWDYQSDNESYGYIVPNNFPWKVLFVINRLSMSNLAAPAPAYSAGVLGNDDYNKRIYTFKDSGEFPERSPYYFASSFLLYDDHALSYYRRKLGDIHTTAPVYLTSFNGGYSHLGWNIRRSSTEYLETAPYDSDDGQFTQLHLPPYNVQHKNPQVIFVIQNYLTLEQLEKISGYTIHSYYKSLKMGE